MISFLDSVVVKLILTILGIAGLPVSIYFGLLGVKRKKLNCYMEYVSLIRNKKTKFDKIKVLFDNEEVDNISITEFTIWNAGKSVIRKEDVAYGKELKISVKDDSSILDAKVLLENEVSNLLKINSINEKQIEIGFDYFDEKEGGVVQVIHTGTRKSLNVDCKIKGGKGVNSFSYDIKPMFSFNFLNKKMRKNLAIIMIILVSLLLFGFSMILTSAIYIDEFQTLFFGVANYETLKKFMTTATLSWVYTLFFVFMMGPAMKRIFGMGIPNSLKKHSN